MLPPRGAEFDAWLHTPPGRYMLAWEQAQFDRIVADIFGFHALQLGAPTLMSLRANRMPHRWLAVDDGGLASDEGMSLTSDPMDPQSLALRRRVDLRCHFDALPIKSQSLDLVTIPHALELAKDPHETLREVERVLVPEGRVVITGFNRASLWGMTQRAGHLRQRLGGRRALYLPRSGDFIGYRRLRDWLRLLSIEIEGGRFGCYVPPVATESWLHRFAWMEKTGDRWWPVFGAVYVIVAVKRVRGMRLVGLAKRARVKGSAAPAVATHHGAGSSMRSEGDGIDP